MHQTPQHQAQQALLAVQDLERQRLAPQHQQALAQVALEAYLNHKSSPALVENLPQHQHHNQNYKD